MPYIVHQIGDATVCHFELADTITIGRSNDNHIVLDDATVSAHHAVIEKSGGQYTIRDLDSTNGVFINKQRLPQSAISESDIIVIGTHNLRLLETLPDELQKTLKIKKSWLPGVYYTAR